MSPEPPAAAAAAAAEKQAYDRGVLAGEISQRLAGHDEHLRHINGSIDQMTGAVRQLAQELQASTAAQKVRDAEAISAAKTLAAETERRRSILAESTASTDRVFSKRERILGLVLTIVALMVTVYLGTH